MTRAYDMSTRARRAAQTRERILDATEALLTDVPLGEVTLAAIAEGASVSGQTVLRHLGSREGCFEAVGRRVADRVEAQRGAAPEGDVDAALASLLAHYEAEGRLILSLLAQEAVEPFASDAVAAGRAYHRSWVGRVLGLHADAPSAEVDALVAATDLYVWKLLRLDLGRSPDATLATMTRMVHALLEAPCPRS